MSEQPAYPSVQDLIDHLTIVVCERFGEPTPLASFDPFSPHYIAHHGLNLIRAAFEYTEAQEANSENLSVLRPADTAAHA